jgi:hypothetical protein
MFSIVVKPFVKKTTEKQFVGLFCGECASFWFCVDIFMVNYSM